MGNSGSKDCGSEPLNVVILGKHKVGKRSVGNAILRRKKFRKLGVFSKRPVVKQGDVDGRLIKVVHAPGWTGSTRTKSAYSREDIKNSCSEGLVAFLLVVSIDSMFTEKDQKLVEKDMNLISSSVWEHTVLLFTHKSGKQRNCEMTDDINERADLNWLKEKGGGRCFIFNKEKTQVTSLRTELENVAKRHDGVTNFFEEKTETDNGKQQENFQQQQQATTIGHGQRTTNQENHHAAVDLTRSASEGPDEDEAADAGASLCCCWSRMCPCISSDRQGVKENMGKKLERGCRKLKDIKTAQKQEMAKFCRFLVSITDTTGPIDEKLEDFKHQSALFVDENRDDLIERITTPIPIADSLFAKNMINRQLYDEIRKEEINPKSTRLIYTALNTDAKKVAFLKLLIQKDRYLVQDLAEKKLQELEASDDVH